MKCSENILAYTTEIALLNGITMAGGAAISIPGTFRVATEKTRQSLSLNHVHEMLSDKLFEIQLRKSSWASSNSTHATLSIISYMEKHDAPATTTDRISKKIKPLEISEVQVMATTTAAGSSNAPPKFEPPTPSKKV
ncbi:hypothetical protein KY284_011403 [Solanum tuberosum]|nr:hypothetical protein KY284_011403 [Solanum tuberosum]